MPVTIIVLALVIGIAWLVGCCILISKITEKSTKTTLVIIAIVLFILSAGGFIGIQAGAAIGKEMLDTSGDLLEEYLEKNHGNVQLVRSGVDKSEVPQAINDLEAIVPRRISEFGLEGIILEGLYKNALTKGFDIIRSKADVIAGFANDDGKVTSSTIITALIWEINSLAQRIILYSTLCTVFILAVYLCICIIFALKKPKEAGAARGER